MFARGKRRKFFAAFFVFLVAGLGLWTGYLWWNLFGSAPNVGPTNMIGRAEEDTKNTARRLIDGVKVLPIEATTTLWAVMIDNFPESRPQAGLRDASLVWEAPVEGGLTRFLSVFPGTSQLERIGPVRSTRPYYIDWAQELGALYAHVGGSDAALEELKTGRVFDLNEFYRGQYFWRDGKRPKPYNVYTSSKLLSAAYEKEPKDIPSWIYKNEKELKDRGEPQSFKINFGKVLVEWRYNRGDNSYERLEDGLEHKDEKGSIIKAKNVVMQFVEITVLDEVGRREIKTVGRGEATILLDGELIKGRWEKKTKNGRTRFFDTNGHEMEFNGGPTWIEVVDSSMILGN